MKKILSYILIAVIISANLLAPISFGFSKNNSAKVTANVAEAAGVSFVDNGFDGQPTDTTIDVSANLFWADSKNIDKDNSYVTFYLYKGDKTLKEPSKVLASNISSWPYGGWMASSTFSSKITPNTQYYIKATAVEVDNVNGKKIQSSATTKMIPVKTTIKDTLSESSSKSTNTTLPACMGLTTGISIPGCFAQFLYYAVFTPASALFAIAGMFFDYTFHYAVQSSTYQTPFVNQGWRLIRDFANMFFIFILLYIAFGTILDLNGFKTKEMIVNVIIIGLLINFSLFAARLVVDSSNILARVFYNSNAINITKVSDINGIDVTGFLSGAGKSGILPLSSAIVNKVNPQRLIQNANKAANLVPDIGKQGEKSSSDSPIGTGTFIVITLLAAAVSIVGFIVFLSVGFVFVGRVIGLWVAMIIAPLAFFTYTVPAMRNIEMVGWKKWWPNLLELSFLAPVFIFFMYLIIQFLQTNLGLGDATGKGALNYILTVTIPFVFIMMLLWQAKKIATKMSGQIGEAMTKAGAAIGGIAVGAATGGAAMAMRGTAGRLGSKIAGGERVKKWASSNNKFTRFLGNKTMDAAQSISKKSFDPRNTKLGSLTEKGLGVKLGKAKTGGFEKYKTDKDVANEKRKQRRAEDLNVGENSKKSKDLRKEEMGLQDVLNSVVVDFERIDEELKKARKDKKDGDPTAALRIEGLKKAKKNIKEVDGSTASIRRAQSDARRAHTMYTAMAPNDPRRKDAEEFYLNMEAVAKAAEAAGRNGGQSIKDRKESIKQGKDDIKEESRKRRNSYAKGLRTWGSKSNKNAQYKIIMESKIEDKDE